MALTRSFKETVKARAERDSAFREALTVENSGAIKGLSETTMQGDSDGADRPLPGGRKPTMATRQALIQMHLAQDRFTLPDIPDWKLERRAVAAYKELLVRHLRATAAVHGYTHAQLGWRLRVSPYRTGRLLNGHVILDTPEKLHRMVLRLNPQADVPAPDTIPAMTEAEREEALAGIRKKLDASLADPRPPIPAKEVFARLQAKFRTLRPMDHLPVDGRLIHGRYTGIYGRDPDTGLYHGEVEKLRDVVTFQARNLPELETAFADAVADYEAFCCQPAGR